MADIIVEIIDSTAIVIETPATQGVPGPTGPAGTTNHTALTNLDYTSSGHTGFQPTGDYATNSDLSTLSGTLFNQIPTDYYTTYEVDTISGSLHNEVEAIPLISGTAQGQMAFWDNTLKKWTYIETSELFWDDTNKRLGIGTTNTTKALNVGGDFAFAPVLKPVTIGFLPSLAGLGAGNLSNGYYYYAVRYVTADGGKTEGYSAGSGQRVTVVDKTINGQVALTGIPISPDPRVVAREIYRTGVNGAEYRENYLATINDNTTTTYIDNIADAGLGATMFKEANTTAGRIYFNNNLILQSTGVYTTSFGFGALPNGGGDCVAVGGEALHFNTATNNTAIGKEASYANTAGFSNTAVGVVSLQNNTTGSYNVAVGNNSLQNATIPLGMTAIGPYAFFGATTNLSYGVALGYFAGAYANGRYNIFIGYNAGYHATATSLGQCNIVIGADAGKTLGSGANNIILGKTVELALPNSSNQLNIGNVIYATGLGTGSTPSATGNVGIGIIPTARLTLPAGTATANTAPLKFTAGTALTTAEVGAVEFVDDGTDGHLYITLNIGGTLTRKEIAFV